MAAGYLGRRLRLRPHRSASRRDRELAVDPNEDGDAHDAARVALVGVVEPFAAFTDGPLAAAAAATSAPGQVRRGENFMSIRTIGMARRASICRSALAVAILGLPAAIHAQSTDTPAQTQESDGEADPEIVVTGTSIHGVPPTGSDLIGVTREDIGSSARRPRPKLTKVPQLNSFNTRRGRANGLGGHSTAPGLRGLNPTATLILLTASGWSPEPAAEQPRPFVDPAGGHRAGRDRRRRRLGHLRLGRRGRGRQHHHPPEPGRAPRRRPQGLGADGYDTIDSARRVRQGVVDSGSAISSPPTKENGNITGELRPAVLHRGPPALRRASTRVRPITAPAERERSPG